MVPTPSRRQLLAGLLGAAGVGSVAAAPRTWYPDPVVDRLLGRRQLPDTDASPPAPESLLAAGIETLEEHLDHAESLWNDVTDDRDELPRDARFGPTLLSEAHDHHGELLDSSPDRDAVHTLRRAHGNVGYAIGAGQLVREETDAEALVARGDALRTEIDDLRDRIAYRVADSAADVPTLYWIEHRLVVASLNTHRGGVYAGGTAPADEYEGHDFPTTWEAQLQAEVDLLGASHTYREFDGGDDDGHSIADGVDSLYEALSEEVERTREPHEKRDEMLDDFPDGPYAHARFRLWHASHGNLDVHPDEGVWADSDLLRTVRHARNVLKIRAYPDAAERFEFGPGEDPDPAYAYRAEREGARRLRALVDEYDTPLFRLLVDEAAGSLRSAHIGVTRRDDAEERARARAQAYASYLFGDAQLRHAADVYETVLGELE